MSRRSTDWLVKVRRYDGSESVLAQWRTEQEARLDAELRNAGEQSDCYYAEPFDPARLSFPFPRHGKRNRYYAKESDR